MKKGNDLAKNTILLSLGTFLNKGLQFIMIPFFSSWLSTEQYGVFDVVCTYITLLIPIVTLASSNAVFRFSIDADDKEKKNIITNGLIIDMLNLLIICLCLILIRVIFDWKLAIPFLILLIGEIFNNFLQGCMRGIKKLNIYSFCTAFSTLLIAIFTVLFLKVFNFGLNGIIYGYAIGYLLGDILIVFITKIYKYIDYKKISFNLIKKMTHYSFPLIFNDISWWIVNVSDRSIVNFFIGTTANGIYAIANKIPSLCTSVFSMFNISWQQAASEMNDAVERKKYFQKIYNQSTNILISLCVGIISANFIFFDFVFSSKYNLGRFHSPILVFSIIFNTMSQFIGGIQISMKNTKENGVTTVIAAIINIIINLVLIKYIGLYAASLSTLISNIVLFIIRKHRLKKHVVLSLNLKTKVYFLIFAYIFICEYLSLNYIIKFTNLLFACIFFIYINKNMISKIIKKIAKIS